MLLQLLQPLSRRGMPAHFKYSHVCVCVLPLAHALLSFIDALRPSAPFSVAHSSPLLHSRSVLLQTLCTRCIPFLQVAIDGRARFFVMEELQFNLYSPCIDYPNPLAGLRSAAWLLRREPVLIPQPATCWHVGSAQPCPRFHTDSPGLVIHPPH